MIQQTFLVEIGTEELPPKILRSLGEAFASQLSAQLVSISLPHADVSWFATPRRLAVKVASLGIRQADREVEKRGPPVAQAYDAEGKATQAAEGWARSCGIGIDQAERLVTDKGEWLFYRSRIAGRPAAALLADAVNDALVKLPVSKLMRWGDKSHQFVRPVRTVTLLLGEALVPGTIMGVHSDRVIYGHRFMGETQFTLDHADQYPKILSERGNVIADYALRKHMIKKDIVLAAQKTGGVADISEILLEEVTSLVEWPVVLVASFDEKFLAVPPEALVCTMKADQRYFPIYDAAGKLMPHFIFVANIESRDPQQVISGNEKVVRPRLADAEFFFTTDRKKRLEDYLPCLETVVFQQHLGTLRDKTDRLQHLAGWIAKQTGADIAQAMRAGLLSKCDLVTSMVFEFPETQGVMGMHYARFDGENEEVALALNEQYQPRFSGDTLPSTSISRALAIADKMDTLTGMIGSGQHPKGDKDPFALRRAALGVLRIIIDNNLLLDLQTMAEETVSFYNNRLSNPSVVHDVVDFMLGRLRAWYQEEGYHADTLQAVLACHPRRPADFDARVKAVTHFRTLTESAVLAAADKRVANMLSQCADTLHDEVNLALLTEPAEKKLMMQLAKLREDLEPLFSEGRYQDALVALAVLHQAVDDFFNHVLVMDKEDAIRINRLTLLNQLRTLFLRVADFSVLQ